MATLTSKSSDSQEGEVISKLEEFVTALTDLANAADAHSFKKIWDPVETGAQLRGQTGSLLAISRNTGLFQREMCESSQTRAWLEEFSKVFEGLQTGRANVNDHTHGVQAAIAGKLASGLLEIFSDTHDAVKNMLPAILGALQSGRLGELPADAINAVLDKMTSGLAKLMPAVNTDAGGKTSPANATEATLDMEKSRYKPAFTSLEKMGFIMSGSKVQNPMEQRKVELLQQISQGITQLAGRGYNSAVQTGVHIQTALATGNFNAV